MYISLGALLAVIGLILVLFTAADTIGIILIIAGLVVALVTGVGFGRTRRDTI
jgi:hypothetical protein